MDLNYTDSEPICCYEKYLVELIKRSEEENSQQTAEGTAWSDSLKGILLRHRQKKAARLARRSPPVRPPQTYKNHQKQQLGQLILVALSTVLVTAGLFYFFF